MIANDVVTALSSLLSIAALWVMFFWFYREYRLDLTRQRLFGLRDELFDLARSGRLHFSHPAYGMLRRVMNGSIRHGHRLGLVNMTLFYLLIRRDPAMIGLVTSFETRWEEASSSLPEDVQHQLLSIRQRLHAQLAEHLLFTQPILFFALLPLVVWFALRISGIALGRAVQFALGAPRAAGLANALDSVALVAGGDDWLALEDVGVQLS